MAANRGTFWDSASMFFALVGVIVPLSVVLQYFLGLKLYEVTGVEVFAILGWGLENSKILPAFALAFGSMATISRLMRTSMLDVLNSDYIKTAKAKGLSQKAIIWNTQFERDYACHYSNGEPLVASVLTGVFVAENIFAIPGLGNTSYNAQNNYQSLPVLRFSMVHS